MYVQLSLSPSVEEGGGVPADFPEYFAQCPKLMSVMDGLNLVALQTDEWVVVHRRDFDLVDACGEPHRSVNVMHNVRTKATLVRVHGATRQRFSVAGDVTVLTNLIESVFSRVLCLGLQTNQELNSAGVEFPLLNVPFTRRVSENCEGVFDGGRHGMAACKICRIGSNEMRTRADLGGSGSELFSQRFNITKRNAEDDADFQLELKRPRVECVAVTEEGEEGLDGVGDWMDGGGASYEGATNNEVSDSDSVMETSNPIVKLETEDDVRGYNDDSFDMFGAGDYGQDAGTGDFVPLKFEEKDYDRDQDDSRVGDSVDPKDPTFEIGNKKKRGRPRLLQTKQERTPHNYKVVHLSKSKSKFTLMAVEAINKSEPRALTISEIFAFVCREYSQFSMEEKNWQNSIRHNLSITPGFQRIPKKEGRGSLWVIRGGEHVMDAEGRVVGREDYAPRKPKKARKGPRRTFEGKISVEAKRDLLKKYDELKLDQLTQEKAAEQLATEFPDLGINVSKIKRILDRRDYFEADDGDDEEVDENSAEPSAAPPAQVLDPKTGKIVIRRGGCPAGLKRVPFVPTQMDEEEKATIEYLRSMKLIRRVSPVCAEGGCGRTMSYVNMGINTQNTRNNLTRYCYRCPRHRNKKITLRKGSFFESCSKQPLTQCLTWLKAFAYKLLGFHHKMCSIQEFKFAYRVRNLLLGKWLSTKVPRIGGISVHVEICVFHMLNTKKDRIERCFLAGICPHDSHSFVESIPPPGDYLDHVTGILGVLERFVEPGSIIAASRVKGVRTKEYRAPVHVDYVQEIRNINVVPRFSIDHGGRVDNINEYLDRLIKRTCYELRGSTGKHYEAHLAEFRWRNVYGKGNGDETLAVLLQQMAELYPTPGE